MLRLEREHQPRRALRFVELVQMHTAWVVVAQIQRDEVTLLVDRQKVRHRVAARLAMVMRQLQVLGGERQRNRTLMPQAIATLVHAPRQHHTDRALAVAQTRAAQHSRTEVVDIDTALRDIQRSLNRARAIEPRLMHHGRHFEVLRTVARRVLNRQVVDVAHIVGRPTGQSHASSGRQFVGVMRTQSRVNPRDGDRACLRILPQHTDALLLGMLD